MLAGWCCESLESKWPFDKFGESTDPFRACSRSYWLGRFGSSTLAKIKRCGRNHDEVGRPVPDAVPKEGDEGLFDPYNNDKATASRRAGGPVRCAAHGRGGPTVFLPGSSH